MMSEGAHTEFNNITADFHLNIDPVRVKLGF
jgi:hypothetical protein